MGNEDWWKDIQKKYQLSNRPIPFDKEFDYYDQVVTISYFYLIFGTFESSVRLIVRQYDLNLYNLQKDFNPLCKKLINNLKLENKDKFIDLTTSLRNSIHNNGLYMPKVSTKSKRFVWNNAHFQFDECKPIIIKNLWSSLIPISQEIYNIFSEIINSDPVKKIPYYHDPMEI
jgi:hypothetical protein